MGCCLLVSLVCFAHIGYLECKSYLAQALLEHAWTQTQTQREEQTQAGENFRLNIKPWPWADVYPVAKLSIERLNLSYLVLNNDSGQALAFGPGLSGISNNSAFDFTKTQVMSGHRDSHFEFLSQVIVGDELLVESPSGQVTSYIIDQFSVIDSRVTELYLPDDLLGYFSENEENTSVGLVLLTCYPFNSASASTPYRYVVEAHKV